MTNLLSERIARLRKERGLTQEQLGQLVGVSAQAVSKWEKGGAPDVERLPALADRLGVTIDGLFGRESGENLDLRREVCRWMASLPEEDSMDQLIRLLWEIVKNIKECDVAISEVGFMRTGEMTDESKERMLMRTTLRLAGGLLLGVFAEDMSFVTICPEPAAGYAAHFSETEDYRTLFEVLGKPDRLALLLDLYTDKEKYYTVEAAAKRIDLENGLTREILEDLRAVHLVNAIELEHLSFGYEADKPVLKDVSLRFESGKKYAIVGGSGSGKSTLLNLLMGSYGGYEGSLTIDGIQMREISTDSLYDLTSLIGQSVFLFDDTLKNNITMFREFPAEQVEAAVKRSGLQQLVSERGMDYRCGENGVNLSGGERQRVSIARCLLRGTPVLLLDEATAALDNQTAFAVTGAILHLDGLTRIVVTHRLETALLEQYDGIIVLRDGQVLEQGTFGELMDRKGYFYSLFTLAA